MGILNSLTFIVLFLIRSFLFDFSIFSYGSMIDVCVNTTCFHEYIDKTFGILSSPCYPHSYPRLTLCKWKIRVPNNSRVVLSIRNFNLGHGDVLEVFGSINGKKISYDKSNPPEDILYSLGSSLTLTLKAGETDSKMKVLVDEMSSSKSFSAIFETFGCGGLLTSDNGYIIVPSYIHHLQSSQECVWSIIGSKNKVVILSFLEFTLPPGTCLYNKLQVRDGERNTGFVIGDFCEENPPLNDLRTATNVMFITYRTRPNFLFKNTEEIPTIKMYYHFADACGGKLTSLTGSLSSPKFQLSEVVCNWTIDVPEGRQLLLNIHNWKSFNSSGTDYDELSFIFPIKQSHTFSSQYNVTPKPLMIFPTNRLTIMFVSHRKKPSKAKLVFYGVYKALPTPSQQCIDVSIKKFFNCDEWNYIDCKSRCNGIKDCENGKDEEHCSPERSENEFDIQRDILKKSINVSIYFTFLFVAICTSLIIVIASVTFSQFYKQNENDTLPGQNLCLSQYPVYPNVYLTPYGSKDICTVSTFRRAPPPYPYNFDETTYTDESSLRLSLVAVSVANQTLQDESNSTTCTDRLRELDAEANQVERTQSLETLFLVNGTNL